ncbi:unnamed protein product [Rotaria magnacalcarata]|uniref:Uncharacterized protein n=1 Tax=Rotaria magnacalcarata TaxID=392030 RepID=A0A815YHF4_9BILA|nr:unnamed protein product [Rotaria magnacalcarata]
MDYSRSDHSDVGADINIAFPDNYKIPPLPKALIKYIEDGILEKFGPHCANRQILIDAIIYDLLDQYNLFYPTYKQFDDITTVIVKYIKLPSTKQNITVWKDALQTKLKRKLFENPNNGVVQEYRLKYSRSGSGHPVKRKIGEIAERDRYKQVFEEVNMLMKIDLSAPVRRQIPILLEKVLETPMFITDSPHLRLLKVLCRRFDETLQHTLCGMDSSTVTQTAEPKPSNNNSDIPVATNECRNNSENRVLASLNSQNTATQQRKRKINKNLDDENAMFLNTSEKNMHQISTPHQVPLNDTTNSTAHTRQNKKKRRC